MMRVAWILVVLTLSALAGCLNGPKELVCTSDSRGNHLSWTSVDNATSYQVYRVEPGKNATPENATQIANTTGTEYTDTNVTDGAEYQYAVTATVQNGTTETLTAPSAVCRVTSVPFFPSGAALVAAVAGAGIVVAVVVMRRHE